MIDTYIKPDQITTLGAVNNGVGWLHIPEGDLRLGNGMTLKRTSGNKFAAIMERLGQADQVLEFAEWVGNDRLKVIATVDQHPHGTLLHASVSYPKRDPGWNIIKHVREALFPSQIDVMMVLPRHQDYVNVMPHCFQMHQCPEKWGIR